MSDFVAQNIWFAIEQTDDPNTRVYHSRLRLLDAYATVQAFANMTHINDARGEIVPISGFPQLLLEIRGVVWINVNAHQFVVRKSPIFEWREIDESLMQLMYGVKQAMSLPVFAVRDGGETQSVVPNE